MFPSFDEQMEVRRKAILKLVVACFVGGVIGGLVYWTYGLALESSIIPHLRIPGAPSLSYGQQFALMMCVASVL